MSCPSFPGCAISPVEAQSSLGSAPQEEAYLVVETPKPWPAKVKKIEGLLASLKDVLKKHARVNFKLLVTPNLPWLKESKIPRALLLQWNGEQGLTQVIDAAPESLKDALSAPPAGEAMPLYLVCTHGSRDPCCGQLGVPIFRRLCEVSERGVLQVSHLGGHRFAPVMVAFPEWRFFGQFQPDMCEALDSALAKGEAPPQGYRGHGRLDSHLQVVEAQLWSEYGEQLLSVRQTTGDNFSGVAESRLKNGLSMQHQFEIDTFEYDGFKSCKEIRKGKESRLKLPVLKRLTRMKTPN